MRIPFDELNPLTRRAVLLLKTLLAQQEPTWAHVQITLDDLHSELSSPTVDWILKPLDPQSQTR